jgi:hypothetical protein
MRGYDEQAAHLFSYVSPEKRVPANHPLRAIREMMDRVLATLSRKFTRMYSDIGRPGSVPDLYGRERRKTANSLWRACRSRPVSPRLNKSGTLPFFTVRVISGSFMPMKFFFCRNFASTISNFAICAFAASTSALALSSLAISALASSFALASASALILAASAIT